MGLSHEDMRAMANGIAGPLHEHVQKAVSPLLERIAALEARVAEAEKGGLRYEGTHQRAAQYKRGSVVTKGGSLWVALRTIEDGEIPGEGNNSWQLCVKGTR